MASNSENCGFGDVMLSYMYDELTAAERDRFEGHLPACVTCTDEFAAMADARFSVYEWQKMEFAEMPTPEIVIPYGVQAQNVRVGMFESIRAWVAAWRWAFAASFMVIVGLAVATVYYADRQNEEASKGIDAVGTSTSVVVPQNDVVEIEKRPAVSAPLLAAQRPLKRRNTPAAIPVKFVRPASKPKTFTNTTIAVHNVQTLDTAKAPVLSGDDNSDDNSLRLTDLFEAEVGANR